MSYLTAIKKDREIMINRLREVKSMADGFQILAQQSGVQEVKDAYNTDEGKKIVNEAIVVSHVLSTLLKSFKAI